MGLKSILRPDEDLSWTLEVQYGLIRTQKEPTVVNEDPIKPLSGSVEALARP